MLGYSLPQRWEDMDAVFLDDYIKKDSSQIHEKDMFGV